MAEGGLVSKSADNLGFKSRNFYENALFKVFLSIVYAAFALFCLGFSSQAAGKSRAAYYMNDAAYSNDVENGFYSMVTGYGFASFFYFCAFAIMIGAAVHISPFFNGSVKEASTARQPLDLEK